FPGAGGVYGAGAGVAGGPNPPEGALITYYVKEYQGAGVSIAITTASGRAVANLTGPGTPGFNRVAWDLRPTGDLLNSYGGEGKKFMPTGEYTVTMTYGSFKASRKLRVTIEAGLETR
ncbi:MAG: hypothetical protein AB1428_14520, partial [Bacteroidota bacterium]